MRYWILAVLISAPAVAQPTSVQPNYCFGFLNAAPNRPDLPNEEALRIQKSHLAHLTALAEKRWLVAAGPVLTPGGPRGFLISKCKSLAEANELTSADPAVQKGRLVAKNHLWSGPEGIGDGYWKQKAENPRAPDRMVKMVVALLQKGADWKGWPAPEVIAAHRSNIESLRKAGPLVAAGPFQPGGDWLGVFIFQGMTLEEARRTAEQDPLASRGNAHAVAYEWMVAEGVFPKSP